MGWMMKETFGFCKFMFEIPSGHPSGDIQGTSRYMSMDFSGEIWARDTKLGIFAI